MKFANFQPPSRYTRLFLRIALPILLFSLVTLLLSYLDQRAVDPINAKHRCRPLLEYPVAGFAITAGGAVVIELLSKVGEE